MNVLKSKYYNIDDNERFNTYPRPKLVRDNYFLLNGEYDLTCLNKDTKEEIYQGTVIVPYPVESLLSKVNKVFPLNTEYIYKKTFNYHKVTNKKIILNIDGIDQKGLVYLNNKYVGEINFPYFRFSFEVQDYIEEENTLEIKVYDTLDHSYPWGKQKVKRGGMWYTPCSGIWKSVWLEDVPLTYVNSIDVYNTLDSVTIDVTGVDDYKVIFNNQEYYSNNRKVDIKIDNPILWTPENPYLYDFTIVTSEEVVSSYFTLRTVSIKNIDGIKRICLNDKPYFFNGLLDQGYFSDGIFTPASYKVYDDDIMLAKKLGFNTLRKHIKIEPDYFYYACDKLGMIVFQDMINIRDYHFFSDTVIPTIFPFVKYRNKKNVPLKDEFNFQMVLMNTVKTLKNYNCVCYWTIFNEGWGEFNPDYWYDMLKSIDSTRIIDTTSGWFKGNKSDVESLHIYFKPLVKKITDSPLVISEYGGYVYKINEHSYNQDKTYGYKIFKTKEEFINGLDYLFNKELKPLLEQGLSAAIYTQLSDVEDETNGLITYDREVIKIENNLLK